MTQPAKTAPPAWMPFMSVCRRWCTIIHRTPLFWRHIVVRHVTPWTHTALARSRGAPLTLLFKENALDADNPHLASIISQYGHRIERLCVYETLWPLIRDSFRTLLGTELPLLTELNADLGHWDGRVLSSRTPGENGQDKKSPFCVDNYPRLARLSLNNVTVPWTPALVANLRALSLTRCDFARGELSLAEFVDVLAHGQRLESLLLDGVVGAWHGVSTDDDGPRPTAAPLALPRLRELALESCGVQDIARVLSYLQLPPQGNVTLSETRRHPPPGHGMHAAMLPAGVRGDPCLARSATHVRVAVDRCGSTLSLTTCAGLALTTRCCCPSREQHAPDDRWALLLGATLDEAAGLLAGAPVESLSVDGLFGAVGGDTWRALFGSVPGLKSLTLVPRDQRSDTVAHALGALARAPDGCGRLRCPLLEVLAVRNWNWEFEPDRVLSESLKARADRGAPPLRSVTVSGKE